MKEGSGRSFPGRTTPELGHIQVCGDFGMFSRGWPGPGTQWPSPQGAGPTGGRPGYLRSERTFASPTQVCVLGAAQTRCRFRGKSAIYCIADLTSGSPTAAPRALPPRSRGDVGAGRRTAGGADARQQGRGAGQSRLLGGSRSVLQQTAVTCSFRRTVATELRSGTDTATPRVTGGWHARVPLGALWACGSWRTGWGAAS